jgi:rhamnogalacturonan endolyase
MAVRTNSRDRTARRRERRRLHFERLEDRRLLSLSHLYTFNDGLANDWIGTAHGTLFNGATVAGGQLVLANNGVTSGQAAVVQYARLGANILSGGDATVEIWFTATDAANWARVFDVGNQAAGVGDSYLAFTPQSSFDDSRAMLRPSAAAERVASSLTTDDGGEHMAAVVIDTTAGLLRLFLDGNEVGAAPLDGASADSVNDSIAYLGRSLFNVDPGYTGSINELRIYDDARSPIDVAADATAGPSTANKSPLVRQMEYLDRGVVAVRRSSTQAYVGWRLLGTDPSDIAFNLYRSTGDGAAVKLNATPLATTTDFVDSAANFAWTNTYFVRPVIGGGEQDASESFTLAAEAPVQQYLNIPLQIPAGGTTPANENYTYNANDASVGDLDGDGQYEIVLKWDPSNSKDNSQSGYTGNVFVDAYRLDGTRLWRIDLGRNMRAGAHYSPFLVYDFDGDGKAEVVMRTAEATVDGVGTVIGNANADYRNSSGYVLSGPEYYTVFDGKTGAIIDSIAFEPERGSVSSWGDSYGNRVDRFQATPAYLDGMHPSIVVGRGYAGPQSGFSARNEVAAYDYRNGELSLRWVFEAATNGANSGYVGQSAHSITVGDLDGDGKDEVITGGAALDDDGKLLYITGRGHGDAMHLTDMDPARPGLEFFMPHESPAAYGNAGGESRDARTGELIFGIPATNDVGRGVAFDVDPNYPGYEMWATTDDPNGNPRMIYSSQGQAIYAMPANMHVNFGVWWDADLLRETLDGTTIGDWNYVTAGRQNFNLASSSRASNNGTKSTPSLSADIFGDWREEVIWRRSDNTELQIWTTTIVATNRIYTLMHDPQYRQAIAWQNSGYNQPPHPSFFLGAGMAAPPTPQIYTVQFAPGLAGDYNSDNVVDSADYTVWRDTLGSTSDLRADGDGDRAVGPGDYDVWKQNFGAIASGKGGAAASQFARSELSEVETAVFYQLSSTTPPRLSSNLEPATRSTAKSHVAANRTTDLLFALRKFTPIKYRANSPTDGHPSAGVEEDDAFAFADAWDEALSEPELLQRRLF